VLGDPRQLLLLATLQHSYDQDLLRNVIPPAWTLVIEVSFYAAMPLLLLAARRPLARFQRRMRIGVVGAALVASIVATMWLHRYWLDPATQPHPDLRPFSYALPVWWDAFAFGMLAALAIAAGRGRLPLARELRYAALVPALAAWEYFGDPGVDRNTLFAGACALAIVGIAGTEPVLVTRVLEQPALRRLGWWSYGMYLWHLPIQYALVQRGLIHHDDPSSTWLWLPVMLTLATTAGWLSYRFVEAPLLRQIDRRGWWRPRNRRAATAGV
jgi:peptidoglycan/LPS O-acetylase OafA/YrhL